MCSTVSEDRRKTECISVPTEPKRLSLLINTNDLSVLGFFFMILDVSVMTVAKVLDSKSVQYESVLEVQIPTFHDIPGTTTSIQQCLSNINS